MVRTKMEDLPGDCLAHVISFTSPVDACRSTTLSSEFRRAADSDVIWEEFLPSDYREIISRSVSPVEFSSKKDLFLQLSSKPILIDRGTKTFSIDRRTKKKCYMLSARELCITWSNNSLYWCFKPLRNSRFPEAVELVMLCWLEIYGTINTRILSPNTTYGAYLVIQFEKRAFGLCNVPWEVAIEVGDHKIRRSVCLKREILIGNKECEIERKINYSHYMKQKRQELDVLYDERACTRDDGWLEIKLGEFYNDESEKEVKMCIREIKGVHLKGGLVIEGIELRPKL